MKQGKRHLAQLAASLAANANIKGFITGTIWRGQSKSVCVPGLNCYSCPGAVGACPIGSLQNAISGNRQGLPFYAVGILILFGVLLGRLICGFLCLFGFIQDLLFKIKAPKLKIPERADKILRYLKYVILLVFVIALPLFVRDKLGLGDPWFCKYICPAGTLEAGIPLIIGNPAIRSMVGFLFSWKAILLVAFVVSSIFIYRPFCKYICPLGAFYGLFNRISFYRLRVDTDKCIDCKKCESVCPMNVKVLKDINSCECIRCGSCKENCPVQAIKRGNMIK